MKALDLNYGLYIHYNYIVYVVIKLYSATNSIMCNIILQFILYSSFLSILYLVVLAIPRITRSVLLPRLFYKRLSCGILCPVVFLKEVV